MRTILPRFRPFLSSFGICLALVWFSPSIWTQETTQIGYQLKRTSKKVLALKAEANDYYRQKKFPEACQIYQEIVSMDSLDAPTRIDLGLCLQNLGKKDSALHVTREALKIAGGSLGRFSQDFWSDPDLRLRKSAYFNLDKLGGPMREPDSGKCETWANFGICAKAFFVCADVGRVKTSRGVERWAILRVGLTKNQAFFSVEEAENPADLPRPEMRDMEAVNIYGDFENRLKWLNRDSIAVLPMGEASPNVESECRVLYFNPCNGVLGLACAIEQPDGQDQIIIGEHYLLPPN